MAQARQIVTESAKGMSNALNNALDSRQISRGTNTLITSLGTLSRSSQTAGQAFKQIGVDLGSLQRITGVTGTQFQQLQSKMLQTSAAKVQERALRDIATAASLTEKEVRSLGTQFGMTQAQIKSVTAGMKETTGSVTMLGTAARTALAYFSVFQVVEFGRAVLDTGIKVDSLQRSFVAISGSTENMIGEFEFLRATAGRTGQNMYALADSYRQLTATTQGTVLEGQKTRDMFSSMSEAAAVLGLSTDKVELSLKAFAQMASKGTVQMEELKGQLGDSLPGALKIAASAMGVTQKALIKMIEKGEVLASDLLPKMSAELHKMYGEAAATASLDSGVAAVNRLSQAWTDLKANLYNNKAAVASINAIGTAIEYWAGAIEDVTDKTSSMAGISEQLKEESRLLSHNKDLLEDYKNGFASSPATIAHYTEKVRQGEAAVADLEKKLVAVKQASDNTFQANIKNAEKITDTFSVLENMAGDSYKAIEEAENQRAQDFWKNEDEMQRKAEQSAEEHKRIAEALSDDRSRLAEELTDILAKEGMTQTEQAKYELDKQYKANLAIAGNDIALAQKVTAAYLIELKKRTTADNSWTAFAQKQHIAAAEKIKDGWQVAAEGRAEADDIANKRIAEGTKETTNVMVDEWSNALGSIQSSIADMIYEFDFSMGSILDIFKRMLAEMAAAIIMSGIKDLLLGQFDIGNLLGGLGGLFSGGKGKSGGGVAGAGLFGDWGKVGGGLALAGGAYGLYSGAKSLSKGNIGSGALGLGLGGAAMYKGAVTLGMIESGTAAGVAKGFASKLGMTGFEKAVEIGTTKSLVSTASTRASMYAAQQSLIGSGGTTAATASTAGSATQSSFLMPSLSSAAPAAAIAVTAFAFGKVISEMLKGSGPSASSEIDVAGITPAHLGDFTKGIKELNGTILESIPGVNKYDKAAYDANTQTLTLYKGLTAVALGFDEARSAGHQWTETTTKEIQDLSEKAKAEASYFSGYWDESFGRVREGANVAGTAAGDAAKKLEEQYISTLRVASATEVFSDNADGMTVTIETLANRQSDLNSKYNKAISQTDSMENSISGLVPTTAEASDQVSMFGDSVIGLGGVAGAAANKMAEAGATINSALDLAYRFSTWSMPGSESMENHATGGIFTQPAIIGAHQFGERGIEGLIPLPDGPDTMTKIIDRLDRIEARQSQTIIVNIAGHEVKRTITPMIDSVVAARQSSGVTGRAYI